MKVLILGATGHVGSRLHTHLQNANISSIAASRGRMRSNIANHVILDSMNLADLTKQLQNVDAVVNCVAGSKDSIGTGAQILTQAALAAGKPTIVHLSTMSVYGASEGVITETSPLDPDYNWYSAAKCEAEAHMQAYSRAGGRVIVLRPGCIYGNGSDQWGRSLYALLKTNRLGDLGLHGNGWSNLVHVNDVVLAIYLGLQTPLKQYAHLIYNLAAPDSPRWNTYFKDLKLSLSQAPVKRVSYIQLIIDSYICNKIIKLMWKFFDTLKIPRATIAEPLPPTLIKLFSQEIQIKSSKILNELEFKFTPYQDGLSDTAYWLSKQFK